MLQVSDLDVSLGGRTIIRNISFRVPCRSFIAVLGPNGGGKSTLLKTLAGLIEPDAGTVTCETGSDNNTSLNTGYVPQIKTLDRSFPARVIDLVVASQNRKWCLSISEAERSAAVDALASVGAAHLADAKMADLSGGELQRVYLARSIIRKPRLLLLDEPETGIDSKGSSDLQTLLETYRDAEDAAIVMVTHDWEVAFHHASHVVLLNGELISFGPPAEALTDHAIRQAYGHVGHAHTMLSRKLSGNQSHDHV